MEAERQVRDEQAGGSRRSRLSRPLLVGGATAVAAVVAVVVLLMGDDEDKGIASGKPTEVSVEELRSFARSSTGPVYWAGPPTSEKLELTRTPNGNVFIRYLTPDAKVGDVRPAFLTVGTYPTKNAYGVAQKGAARPRAVKRRLPDGGLMVQHRERPTSVYLAYRGSDYLVEVYSPNATRARQLVTSGTVTPVR